MGAMKSCLHGAVGVLVVAGGVTAAEAQTFVTPDVLQPPAAAAVVTTVPSATVVQTTPVETTRQVTTTYRTRDRGRVVRRTVVTTRTSPVVVPRTVTEQVVAAPVQNVAPAYASPPYAVQGYTTVAPTIEQVGPPAEVVAPAPMVTERVVTGPGYAPAPAVVAPVAPPRAYRYVYLDDRTLVVDPVTNALLATYWR